MLEAVVAETVAVPSRPSANQLRVTAEVNVHVAQRVAVTIVATATATAAVTAALQPRMTAYHQWPRFSLIIKSVEQQQHEYRSQ